MKILVIRNDKLGDFILSLPVFGLLKNSVPDSQIHALVPEYTADIAKACHWIDEIIIDNATNSIKDTVSLTCELRGFQFDAVITLYSTTRIGLIIALSGIKYRLAPATKIAQIFYNHRLRQRRSLSQKPEFHYNLDLAEHYLKHLGVTAKPVHPPFIEFNADEIETIHKTFVNENQITPENKLAFIHSGSGGSANNLSLEQYSILVKKLASRNVYFILTAGPGELSSAEKLSAMLAATPHSIFYSTKGLVNFAKHIAFADLFISGSTGPLHIAGALNIPTAAFYPRRQSATSLRWQTLNSEDRRIAFSPPESEHHEDMSSINLDDVSEEIRRKYFNED